jgi:phage tail sheath gpL-like
VRRPLESAVITTDHTFCPGSQNVAMIAGEGQHVVTVNVLTGECNQVIGLQLADYQGDALPNDLTAALSSKP